MGTEAEEDVLARLVAQERTGPAPRARFHHHLDATDGAFTEVAVGVAEAMPRLHHAFPSADPGCVAAADRLVATPAPASARSRTPVS